MFRLTYQDGDTPQSYTFSSGEVTIGRSPECQVVLKDFGISRTHAKIVVAEDGLRIVDLKSKNGTQVNGVPVVEAPLKDGDRILLGNFKLTLTKALEGKVVVDEGKPLSEEAGTIIRSVRELSKLLAPAEAPIAPAAEEKTTTTNVEQIERANRILNVLAEFSQKMMLLDVDEVLERVMDIVFEHIQAERGCLNLHDDSGKLVPMVVKNPHSSGEQGKITISKTIVDRVMAEKVAILTQDAQVDPRFGSAASLVLHGIQSVMCVPLYSKDQVLGIVYVDSNLRTNMFTPNDLDLLTALGTYAAIAIERARLNQKILNEEKKRERLGRFLSPRVADRVLSTSESQGADLGAPESKDVSILFADIVGFTSMSERMSPNAVALLLNEYLSRMTEIIFKYEGTLDKYIGDAIMAVFGAPLDMKDHAERSIRAALEMRERLEEFNSERRETPLKIRIGINSGKAVACEIGSINKKEYTVLGDTVNTASRLESSVATPMAIVIGENTYEQVKHLFECKSLGARPLKGKEKVVSAYEVLGVQMAADETAAAHPSAGPVVSGGA
jgi:adenylate cyclase